MLDAFIIDKMQKRKEQEEGKEEPAVQELPLPEDKGTGDPEQQKPEKKVEVTLRF